MNDAEKGGTENGNVFSASKCFTSKEAVCAVSEFEDEAEDNNEEDEEESEDETDLQ